MTFPIAVGLWIFPVALTIVILAVVLLFSVTADPGKWNIGKFTFRPVSWIVSLVAIAITWLIYLGVLL